MKKLIILMLLAVVSPPLTLLAQNPNSNGTNINVFHFSEPFLIPCTGDIVVLDGDVFVLNHSTWNDQHYISKNLFVPRRITATNTRTGQKYLLIGSEQYILNWSNIDNKLSVKGVFHLNFIGQGRDTNYYTFQLAFHNYNRNGELIVEIDEYRIECR